MNDNFEAHGGTVLVVDDNTTNLQVLGEILERDGYETVMVTDGWQALDFLRKERPDIVLLDIMMPSIDGFEVCQRIKSDGFLRDIPVIFITGRSESEDIVKGFEVGGVDYVTKPFNSFELLARIKTQISLARLRLQLILANKKLSEVNQDIKQQNFELTSKVDQLEEIVITDTLTGIFNRRYMQELLGRELSRYSRSRRPFSIISIDIDHFKVINDNYGHETGDGVLITVAQLISGNLRDQDTVARWGGEEFLVFLPDTFLDGALVVAERVRRKMEQQVLDFTETSVGRITLTLGVAEYKGEMIDEVLRRADEALYCGKNEGRNRVIVG